MGVWDRRQGIAAIAFGVVLAMGLTSTSISAASGATHLAPRQAPAPHDTLAITASILYQGTAGTGEAYVYLADSHAALTNPVLVIEGFDIDNSMGWEELYTLLNREGLIETIRAYGFDAVVLNFTDGVDYIQRNAFVIVELIEQVNALIFPGTDIALMGASMGGLAGRYALAYMETQGLEHNTRTFISFDGPQKGANIPLGIQYWVAFFAPYSDDAAVLLAGLDSPAGRQMLVYHHTDPPTAMPTTDPLRAELLADLAAVGEYPLDCRKVAVANGSGMGQGQGFSPGDQIIQWEYEGFLVDVIGNVWALPDAGEQLIFHGLMDPILLPADELMVTVSGTGPYDTAPGGWRASMAQMDSTEAPYGDIIALYPNHCYMPTISSLALDTDDLFYDIAGDPDLLSHTYFDAVYFPAENQEHVLVTPENADWLLSEILWGTSAGIVAADHWMCRTPVIRAIHPNPARGAVQIHLSLPQPGHAHLSVYDIAGRMVAEVAETYRPAGDHRLTWDGTDAQGRQVGVGVYLCRLRVHDRVTTRPVIVVR